VYADASFAVHADMKSQSGIAVSLGAGMELTEACKHIINGGRVICLSFSEEQLSKTC